MKLLDNPFLTLQGINEEETSPVGLGRAKHAFGGWLGQVRLGFMSCDLGSLSILQVVNW